MLVRAAYLLTLAACALAWSIGRTRREHRPVALLLSIGLAVDLVRHDLAALVIVPAYAHFGTGPLQGVARMVGHVDEALFLTWPAALAASALVTFDPAPFDDASARARRRLVLRAVAVVWALASLALAATYPTTRGPVLAHCYLFAELASIVVGLGSVATWVPARRSPEVRHVVIALAIGTELVSALAGPWHFDLFGSWSLAVVSHALFCGATIALQGGMLWWSSTSSSG